MSLVRPLRQAWKKKSIDGVGRAGTHAWLRPFRATIGHTAHRMPECPMVKNHEEWAPISRRRGGQSTNVACQRTRCCILHCVCGPLTPPREILQPCHSEASTKKTAFGNDVSEEQCHSPQWTTFLSGDGTSLQRANCIYSTLGWRSIQRGGLPIKSIAGARGLA